MADTFEAMYRSLRLWVPDLPIFLAQQFIRDRYRRAAERRMWSGLRGEAEFLLNAATTTGTVTLVRGDATVTGIGTSWTASEIGRQFMAGNRAPVYTVLSVNTGAQTLELDRVYGGDSATSVMYRILDAYVTVPSNFQQFMVVYDPKMNWRLRHFMTQADIARLDPARTSSGTPWAVVDRKFNEVLGLPQYEIWPYSHSARNYPYYYSKRVTDVVNDDDTPFYPLRGDILVKGALADCCRWPGTIERPNPMYGKAVELSRQFEAEYEDQLSEMERQDENTYMTWLADTSWSSWPYAPMDASFLQQHAW